MKKPEVSEFLYKECSRQLRLPETERIMCQENIAHAARWQGRNDEAIAGLEKVLRRWEKLGPKKVTDQILQHSWLAGLYLSKGDKRSADGHRKSLLLLLPEFESKAHPALQAHIFLEMADTANTYGDIPLEKQLIERGLEASHQDDKLDAYELYFQQSLGDIAMFGRRQSDYGPDRFRHPDSREWRMRKIGSNFYEPIV